MIDIRYHERAANHFFAAWEELRLCRVSVLDRWEPEDIHDLRVASRRFRGALGMINILLDRRTGKTLLKEIRDLTRSLGRIRNADEALDFFCAPSQRKKNSDAQCLSELLTLLREQERIRAERVLRTFTPQSRDNKVRGMVADLVSISSPEMTPAMLANASLRLFDEVHTLLLQARSTAHGAEARHALRIAIKKWRYFLELAARILDCDFGLVLEQLKEYQSVLGRINDMAEFRLLLENLALSPDERTRAVKKTRREEAKQVRQFFELLETKPLTYYFILQEN